MLSEVVRLFIYVCPWYESSPYRMTPLLIIFLRSVLGKQAQAVTLFVDCFRRNVKTLNVNLPSVSDACPFLVMKMRRERKHRVKGRGGKKMTEKGLVQSQPGVPDRGAVF